MEIIKEFKRTGNQTAIAERGIVSKSAVSKIWTSRVKILHAFATRTSGFKKIKMCEWRYWWKTSELVQRKTEKSWFSLGCSLKANKIAKCTINKCFSCKNNGEPDSKLDILLNWLFFGWIFLFWKNRNFVQILEI